MEAHAYRTGFIIGGIYNASAYGGWYHFHDWVSLSPRASRRARHKETLRPMIHAQRPKATPSDPVISFWGRILLQPKKARIRTRHPRKIAPQTVACEA